MPFAVGPGPFTVGQVAVGGKHGYIEILNPADGSLSHMIHCFDNHGNVIDNVMGCTFDVPGNLYAALSPSPTQAQTPHDVVWMPDNSGLLTAVVPSAGHLELRKYSTAGALINTWSGLRTDTGWSQEPVKIDVACDSRTVYYTDSRKTIFRYDLRLSAQMTNYQQLSSDSPYVYGGIRVLPAKGSILVNGNLELGPVVVVAMTAGGTGPRRAIALGADKTSVWTDEVNPSAKYHVIKRKINDGTFLLSIVTQADTLSTPTNDETLSLACFYKPCDIEGYAYFTMPG